MFDSVRVYWKLVLCNIRKQMQYKASFALMAFGQLLSTVVEFMGLVVLFARFQLLRGWTLPQVGILYGMIHLAFGISEMWGRGFDMFNFMVRKGDFDRVLVRPRSPAMQVMASEFQLLRIGRISQGLAVLIWGCRASGIVWSPLMAWTAVGGILAGILIFMGLLVLQATSCFWSTQTLEVFNMFTFGGVWMAQHPMDIYKSWFRRFFTFIVPIAFANYLPVQALLGREPLLPAAILPLPIGAAFFAASFIFWKFGVSRYRSTGS